MMIGQSPMMRELRARIGRVAGSQFTVLIEGESGAGKELVAREIHQCSGRRGGPFVPVNCAALVESLLEAELFGIEERAATGVRGRRGKFELAHQGTLFLDEIADLSPAAQAKLLRVLQDFTVERVGGHTSYRVDTRIVAATNRNLRALAEADRFRSDLYYRISGVEVMVPPLRDRRRDVPLLVDHFAGRYRRYRQIAFEPDVIDALVAYDWPGNIRQLGRVVERALALAPGPTVTLEDLPAEISESYADVMAPAAGDDRTLRGHASRYARLVLDRCNGNKRRACQILDISYHTLKTHLEYDGTTVRAVPDSAGGGGALASGQSAFCECAGQ
jgi:DNA-binding NtrC family response regulator